MNIKSLFPLLAPFITVLLGIICIPFIEMYKNRHERTQLLKSLIEELKDEIFTIDLEFKELYSCHKKIIQINQSQIDDYSIQCVTPHNLKIYSVEKLLDNHFEKLQVGLRRSMKDLRESMEHLNGTASQLKQLNDEVLLSNLSEKRDFQRLINRQFNYLRNILLYRYNIHYLISILSNQQSELKTFSEIEINQAIIVQLKDMGIEEATQILIENKE